MLRGVVRELPPEGGQLLLVCCEWAHQGVVRLSPPVLALVEHVMDRWNDLVRCVRDPAIPPGTNRLEGWFGRFKPRARLARGLKTPQGAQAFLHLLAGQPEPWRRSRSYPPGPFSTKVKQCQEIARLDKEYQTLLQGSVALHPQATRYRSVPGEGTLTAALRVAFLSSGGQQGSKALTALVGLAPWSRDSGHKRG